MNSLVKQIKNLEKSAVNRKVNKRLNEFDSFKGKNTEAWFSELCFCILTSNSRAQTAWNIQKELGFEGFHKLKENDVRDCIKRNKHRFHNNKAKFIVNARKHKNIKEIVKNEDDAREWLVENVKGLGYKEASHFLRNVGYDDAVILDRHIINLMKEHGIIRKMPKTLTKKWYFKFEKKFKDLAVKVNMTTAELDLYMWYMKTGEVLK